MANTFVQIDPSDRRELTARAGASRGASLLALWLAMNETAFAERSATFTRSLHQLAFETGFTKRWVQDMVTELEGYGFIEVKRTAIQTAEGTPQHLPNVYRLLRGCYTTPRELTSLPREHSSDHVHGNNFPVLIQEEKESKNRRFVPPTLDEVTAYCMDRGNGINPLDFLAHYTANGWIQKGGQKIKDWKATVITWELRRKQQTTSTRPTEVQL